MPFHVVHVHGDKAGSCRRGLARSAVVYAWFKAGLGAFFGDSRSLMHFKCGRHGFEGFRSPVSS